MILVHDVHTVARDMHHVRNRIRHIFDIKKNARNALMNKKLQNELA